MRQLDLSDAACGLFLRHIVGTSFLLWHSRRCPAGMSPSRLGKSRQETVHRALENLLLEWRLKGLTHDAGSAAELGSVFLSTTPRSA
jgi:hypothetical protein